MDDQQLRMCIGEVVHQRTLARIATDQLVAEVRDESHPVAYIFGPAQQILTAAAQISKLAWADTLGLSPDRATFALDRAESLRSVIIPDQILQRRAVRNSVEHFDARLDEAFFENPKLNIIDNNFAPTGAIEIPGAVRLRHLDSSTTEYSALDKSVRLNDLVAAIEAVGDRAQRWLDDH